MKTRPYDHYKPVAGIPDEISHKKRKPKSMAVVDSGNCTGCQVCIPFCPVDCIESTPVEEHSFSAPIPPVRVRYNECIGCAICARVCTKLTWDAIHMFSLADFQAIYPDVEITDQFLPGTVNTGDGDSLVIEI